MSPEAIAVGSPSAERELLPEALDAETQSRYRQRLLEYNEDDVRGTLFLRDWLSSFSPADLPVLPEEG
jgi:predicted RecB family nuclease